MLKSSQHSIVVGDRTVDLARETLRDERGDIVPLRPRAWAVLRLLATRAGQLVGKDEIMDEVWSDCEVTEDSLVQAIGDIRRALGDAGRSALKTLPRRGYMLVVEWRADRRRGRFRRRAASRPILKSWRRHLSMPHLSIIVLPFANIGGDPAQDYFVDGVTESLTTDLSRIAGSFVIAPQHRLHLQGKSRRRQADRPRPERTLRAGRLGAARRQPFSPECAADRHRDRKPCVGRTLRQAGGRTLGHAGRDRVPPGQHLECRTHRRRSATRGTIAPPGRHGPVFPGQSSPEQRRDTLRFWRRQGISSRDPWRSIPAISKRRSPRRRSMCPWDRPSWPMTSTCISTPRRLP